MCVCLFVLQAQKIEHLLRASKEMRTPQFSPSEVIMHCSDQRDDNNTKVTLTNKRHYAMVRHTHLWHIKEVTRPYLQSKLIDHYKNN